MKKEKKYEKSVKKNKIIKLLIKKGFLSKSSRIRKKQIRKYFPEFSKIIGHGSFLLGIFILLIIRKKMKNIFLNK